jgi:hypothetical protein
MSEKKIRIKSKKRLTQTEKSQVKEVMEEKIFKSCSNKQDIEADLKSMCDKFDAKSVLHIFF